MKRLSWIWCILFGFSLTIMSFSPVQAAVDADKLILRQDADHREELPRNFRTLPFLSISGSAQFSEKEFQAMATALQGRQVINVDLRQESHGFVNGIPVSWYGHRNWGNEGKLTYEVLLLEQAALQKLLSQGSVTVHKSLKKDKETGHLKDSEGLLLTPRQVSTERDMVQRAGWGYYRLALTDHRRPLNRDVDTFIRFAKQLPPGVWLHFHCEAGHGRTTTFMAMYDMMKHAKKDSLETIVSRQAAGGGIDLLAGKETGWQAPYGKERTEFIKQFYRYCRENQDGFQTTWSQWLDAQ